MKANRSFLDRPRLRILSEQEVYELHLATLEVLEKTGVEVYDDEALSVLRKAGCFVHGTRVCIPPYLVKRALNSVPERAAIRDRNGRSAMFLEDSRSYYGTGSDCPTTLDIETGERRPSLLSDVASLARLADYTRNIDFVMSMAFPSDVPAATPTVHEFAAMVNNTTKPIVFTAFSLKSLKAIHQICSIVASGEEAFRQNPFVVHYAEPTSPLMHTKEAAEKLLFCADKGIPIVYAPAPMSGATAPSTLAGTIVVANAECLSGLVMQQLRAPGAAFVYGAFITIMDMSSTVFSYGAPELALMSAALAEMAHFYRLPSWSQACCTDAKVVDQQAAAEYMSSALLAGLAGSNLIHDCGYLESGMTSSHESILLADEIVGLVRRILGGIEVNEETIALDVVAEVGPGGSFLTTEHTLSHFRDEFWFPRFFDRERYGKWQELGSRTVLEKLNKEAKRILDEHVPEPLAETKRSEIDEILERLQD